MVIFDRFEMLDAIGPLEAFATARDRLGGVYAIEVMAPRAGLVRSSSGLALEAAAFDAAEAGFDTLLIAGGTGVSEACLDGGLIGAIGRAAVETRRVGSICTGAFLLAETGLLEGRHAVTHWNWCDRLATAHPGILVEPDRIFTRDGAVWTSAGVTAGIDLALAMIEEDHGAEAALAVARELVVFLRRPGGQSQFGVELRMQSTRDGPIRRVCEAIVADPGADHAIERLADAAAMSPRNFARVFRRETGRTPGGFVEEVRVARACRLLEATDLAVEEVARRSGFRSGDVMRRALLRGKGISPSDFRARFGMSRATGGSIIDADGGGAHGRT